MRQINITIQFILLLIYIHHFTIFSQLHWTISQPMKMCLKENWFTILTFNHLKNDTKTIAPISHQKINIFKSSYQITISPFHHLWQMNLFTIGPLHHLEKNKKSITPFHHQNIFTYSNHPTISPLHHINYSISPYQHLLPIVLIHY